MPFRYAIDPDLGLIQVTFTGPTTTRDLADARAAVMADPAYAPRLGLLIDLEEADLTHMSPAMLRERAQRPPGAGAIAVVAGTDLAYGLSRMYEQMSKSPVGVFRHRAEALAWLATLPPR